MIFNHNNNEIVPLQHLVGDRAREAVADVVNAAILLDAQRTARAAAIAAETGARHCSAHLVHSVGRHCGQTCHFCYKVSAP